MKVLTYDNATVEVLSYDKNTDTIQVWISERDGRNKTCMAVTLNREQVQMLVSKFPN